MCATAGLQVLIPGAVAIAATQTLVRPSALAIGLQALDVVLSVPTEMLVNRAVALDEPQAKKPSIFEAFTLPGLLPTVILRSLWSGLVAIPVAAFGVAASDEGATSDQRTMLLAAAIGVQLLGTLVTTPLQVLITRLSIQLDRDFATPPAKFLTSDDAITLPPMSYCGLFDAVQTIVATEGWEALYRGWTWEAVRVVLGSISFAGLLPAAN